MLNSLQTQDSALGLSREFLAGYVFFLFSCVVTINAMLLFFNAVGLPRIVFLALGQKRYELVLAGTRKQ